jgi:hypothetical protein
MSGRLPSSLLVSGLIGMAEAEGGFAAVLAKGDASAGSVLVILTERGADAHLYERILQPNGTYAWRDSAQNPNEVPAFVARRRRFDPDSWVLELDIPSPERFAAAMNALD